MENFTNHSQRDDLGPSDNNFWVLPVAVLPILTVLGNLLVIASVWREKTLQNSTNWLIVSLAFADLLVGLIVMPWGIYASVSFISFHSFIEVVDSKRAPDLHSFLFTFNLRSRMQRNPKIEK